MTRPKLPRALRDHRGISPARRDALIAKAKADALRFSWAVKLRSAAQVAAVTSGYGREEWAALAVVLAEGVQPGSMRLALVARTAGEQAPRGDTDAA